MIGNPLPWIVIAVAVLVTLYLKGHLRLPATTPAPAKPVLLNASTLTPGPGVDIDALVKLGSYALGLALAKAVRAEAESTVAYQMAQDATKAIHDKFTSPFSVPAPAGQDPNQAGVKPNP